tara:strand:+ start:89 stop:484 length:396 start_codon:yes stop_codon:yes gene_type:complete
MARPKNGITAAERFWANVEKSEDCWNWTAGSRFRGSDKKPIKPSRFSYVLHNGPIDSGFHVARTCGSPKCVRPDHLRLEATAVNNTVGEMDRLSTYQIEYIRKRYNPREADDFAEEFGLSHEQLYSIVREV